MRNFQSLGDKELPEGFGTKNPRCMVLSGWIHCETWLNICQFLKSLLLIAADYTETLDCLKIDTRKLWHEYESSSLQSNAFHIQAVVLSMEAISAEVMLHWNLHSATLPASQKMSFHAWMALNRHLSRHKSVAVGNEATKNNASETCLVISTFVTAAWPKCCFWPPTTRDEMSRTKDQHGRIGRGTGYRPADPEVVETRTGVEFGWKWQEMTRVLCTFIVRVW